MELTQLPKFGRGPGLERVRALLDDLTTSAWWRALDALKITGSNGKGSTATMVAAILEALDLPCGLYTSPHLHRFSERIRIAGEEISAADLATSTAWLERRIREEDLEEELGAFEAFTAVALHHFAQHRPAAVVLEAGIGGRHDPTRVPPGNFVALTSIDREHIPLLGNTEEDVLDQKADLCPDGGTLVVGPLPPALLRRLREHAQRRGIRLLNSWDEVPLDLRELTPEGSVVDLKMGDLRLTDLHIALPGRHQMSNAAVALLLVREWLTAHHPDRLEAFPGAARRALATVRWPGQLARVHRDPDIYVDHAHTPAGARYLICTLLELFGLRPFLLVTGVSHDKQIDPILSVFLRGLPNLDTILCTRAHHKGAPVETIRQHVDLWNHGATVVQEPTIEGAMARAVEIARRKGLFVLVAGGLFLAVEAAETLRGGDPAALEFF